MLEYIEEYLLGAILGFAAGAVVSRFFFKSRIERRRLGEVIEWSIIEKTISRLESMTTILNRLIADIKMSAEELTEKIEVAQDMEPVIEVPEKKEENKQNQER